MTQGDAEEARGPLAAAVFALDSWLRVRHGVFEYSSDPKCLFRLQRSVAAYGVALSDGATVEPGEPLLVLHVWNEHVPRMGADGTTLAWAKQLGRLIDSSLRLLAQYLRENAEVGEGVNAICAEMKLGPAEQSDRLAQLSARFGFERVRTRERPHGRLTRVGENIFMLLLVAASNPRSLHAAVLRREPTTAYLSRRVLEDRYGATAPLRVRGQ